jgi:hypothetical protein
VGGGPAGTEAKSLYWEYGVTIVLVGGVAKREGAADWRGEFPGRCGETTGGLETLAGGDAHNGGDVRR